MPPRSEIRRSTIALRPLPAREITIRLDEVLDAVSRVARGGPGHGPRLLAPSDLVRCLSPYTSRN
jgi:hypothetical protein